MQLLPLRYESATGIYLQVEQIAVAIEEFVGRVGVDVEMALNGTLQLVHASYTFYNPRSVR